MTSTQFGALIGILLAIAAIVGGLGGFLLAAAFGLVGSLLTGQFTGRIDISALSLRSVADSWDAMRSKSGQEQEQKR